MSVLVLIAVAGCTIALLMAAYVLWAWYRLHHHPHVEHLQVALPDVADEFHSLIRLVAGAAGVSTPDVYVRRAALPNAFVLAATIRPELYLTDELLEFLDGQDDGFQRLVFILCHEMAHLELGHALPMGVAQFFELLGDKVGLPFIRKFGAHRIARMEEEADVRARQLTDLLWKQFLHENQAAAA